MANKLTVTYNGSNIVNGIEISGDAAVTYNGNNIATVSAGQTKTLNCKDKVMLSNVVVGGKTLLCNAKKMLSNIIIAVTSSFPSEPSAYSLIGTYTSSQTWTAPEDGYFQVEVFGASGNGGSGQYYYNASGYGAYLYYYYAYATGGGGGGGGYACSRVKLKKGDTVSIVRGAVGSTSSATINSSLETYSKITVTSGGTGGNGTCTSNSATAGTGGSAGTASGGNYANTKGDAGSAGTKATASGATSVGKPTSGGKGGSAGATGGNAGGAGGFGSHTTKKETVTYAGSSGEAGFIKIYRGNTNLGGGGGGSNSSVFYIESIDGSVRKSFEFEEGMTWSEFVLSSYNDGSFVLNMGTPNIIAKAGMFAGSSTNSSLGYNGYVVFTGDSIKNNVLAMEEFIYCPEIRSTDVPAEELEKYHNVIADVLVIENGKTYYCDGVS